jgi:hypothetical protein
MLKILLRNFTGKIMLLIRIVLESKGTKILKWGSTFMEVSR